MGVPVVLPGLPAGYDLLKIESDISHGEAEIIGDGPRILRDAYGLRHPSEGVYFFPRRWDRVSFRRSSPEPPAQPARRKDRPCRRWPCERQTHFLRNALQIFIFGPICAFPTLEFSP